MVAERIDLARELPPAVFDLIRSSVNSEFGTVSSAGLPIDSPMGYFTSPDVRTIDLCTGLAYPAKAERVRKNPKVGLFLEGGPDEPVVSIAGMGAVRDSDLQANSERYVAETAFRRAGMAPWELAREAVWYWTRILIEITPARVMWWDNPASMDVAPHRWEAPADMVYPKSDPTWPGSVSAAPKWPEVPWREQAERALARKAPGYLCLCDDEGFPLSVRASEIELLDDGFRMGIPKGAPWRRSGKGTLTFDGRETFVGDVSADGDATRFAFERALPIHPAMEDPTSLWTPTAETKAALMGRIAHETARRGQPIPTVARDEPPTTAGGELRRQRMERLGKPRNLEPQDLN
jgi:hypothetical protein